MSFFLSPLTISVSLVVICFVILILKLTKKNYKDITGEVVLITGGAGGLGKSMALELSKLGAIIAIWDIDQQGINETMEIINNSGGTCYGYICDVSNREDVYEKAALLEKEIGQVDILINNAGICNNISTFLDKSDDYLEHTIRTNFMSHLWTVKAFLPKMKQNNKGHIVSIASICGFIFGPFITEYCATKSANIGFYEGLEKELNAIGCNVNITVVCPSFIFYTGLAVEKHIRYSKLFVLNLEETGKKIVNSIRRNKKFVILPRIIYLFIVLKWISPWVYEKILNVILNRYYRGNIILDSNRIT